MGNQEARVVELASVSRPATDFCDQKVEELNPNLFTCQDETTVYIYKTDIQELNCWQEDPEQLKTVPHSTKKILLQRLGNAERHGESFPALSSIPENEVTSPTTPTPTEEVAGDDNDTRAG